MPLALAGCYFALAGIDHLWAYAAFLPVGMVAGMQNPVLATYVNRRIPSERRATMLSVQAVVASMLTAVLEPTGGFVADQLGLRALFLMFAAICAGVATGTLWLWQRAEDEELRGTARPDLVGEALPERASVS
jgi:MFS family permease